MIYCVSCEYKMVDDKWMLGEKTLNSPNQKIEDRQHDWRCT
jgi:hypothetical protein